MQNRIYLYMGGKEMKYIQEAFDTNWVVPLGSNVNGFDSDVEYIVQQIKKAIL